MITQIEGKLVEFGDNWLTLDVNGICYEISNQLLQALVSRGYVERRVDQRYGVGVKAWEVGCRAAFVEIGCKEPPVANATRGSLRRNAWPGAPFTASVSRLHWRIAWRCASFRPQAFVRLHLSTVRFADSAATSRR